MLSQDVRFPSRQPVRDQQIVAGGQKEDKLSWTGFPWKSGWRKPVGSPSEKFRQLGKYSTKVHTVGSCRERGAKETEITKELMLGLRLANVLEL
jgi:hypothetical protein